MMMADGANGYELRLTVTAGLLLMLGCVVDYTSCYQRPRDGYNTFSDTSTVLPAAAASSSLNVIMNPKWSEPYFDISVPKNVTALVGKSAYMSCRVRNLGNKTVSWIRHRDLHILTVATYTYTTDQRFQTTYHRDVSEWTMQIKWAQKRDAGMYECQVSTQPVQSYSVRLHVVDSLEYVNEPHQPHDSPLNRVYNDGQIDDGGDVARSRPAYANNNDNDNDNDAGDDSGHNIADGMSEPRSAVSALWSRRYALNAHNADNDDDWSQPPPDRVPTATILGGPDLYVDKGSTINLTCAVRFSPEPPAYIFWYHLNKVISYDSTRITMESAKGEPSVSYLLIRNADLADSGKYSCSPSNTDVSSIRVHVLNGERPEAMQTSAATASTRFAGRQHLQPLAFAFLISIIVCVHFSGSGGVAARLTHPKSKRRSTAAAVAVAPDANSSTNRFQDTSSDGWCRCTAGYR